ncbi:MAG: hypothetical protein U9R53_01820 [Chloroflexota bacterium]|nr:hypothetical protein [Chloroflexota bacterium]
MTQIIKTSTPGKEKNRLSKAIVITIREFMRMQEPNDTTNDMLAFIILALEEIASGIDKSVIAWEKRGYWVKADKYRMKWQWTEVYARKLEKALSLNEWGEITNILIQIMGHFDSIKVSDNHRMGKPWLGAHKNFKTLRNNQQ